MTHSVVDRYRYKESGLERVYVLGVNLYKCECGEKLIHIPFIERLHDAIAYDLLKKKTLLIGEEFRFLRKWVSLTIEELKSKLGVSKITIIRCEKGQITPHSDHCMRMFVMRVKEQVCQRQMFVEINVGELFEKMPSKATGPARITIDKDTLENLPFSSADRQLQSA
jgi:DNA-binding XRE family transcriptional regulator